MKNRIFKVMKWAGLNLSQFADALQVSPALLSSVKSERTKPTLLLVENIKRIYPEVDVNWLITGEGEMLVGGNAPGGLHILTDGDAEPEEEAVRPSCHRTDSEEPAEQVQQEETVYHAEEQSPMPDTGNGNTAVRREAVSVVAVGQQPEERSCVIPEKKDGPARAVKQVLLMYNDGTYDSFEKQ